MTDVDHLDLEDLLLFTELLGAGPVSDVGLLDAACARSRSVHFGEDVYPTLELKAAGLMHSICGNHALVDGNKRLALLAVVTFMRVNGGAFALSQDDAFDLTVSVAAGELDVPEIAARMKV